MQLSTQVKPIYFPEPDQTTVLRLGLQPLDPRYWLHVDADLAQFHAHKLEQHQLRPASVVQVQPGAEAAVAELGSMIARHLTEDLRTHHLHGPDRLGHAGSGLSWPLACDDLWQVSLWVQEDLCVLEQSDGSYRLTAASVCSPSNWDTASKMGRSLSAIHDPVPGYAQQLAARVDRLFAALKPAKPLLRYNWSLQAGSELYWQTPPTGSPQPPTHWRVERQTLRRLPKSGAIVFAIRIFLHPLTQLREDPVFSTNLARILAAMPADQRHYKGLENQV